MPLDWIQRLMYRGWTFAHRLQFQRCIKIWLHAIELRYTKDSLLHNESCFATQSMVRLFIGMQEKVAIGARGVKLRCDDVLAATELFMRHFMPIAKQLQMRPLHKQQQELFDKVLSLLTHLFYVLARCPDKSGEQELLMRAMLTEVIRLDPRGSNGEPLLHLVVSRQNMIKSTTFIEEQILVFPDHLLVELLLECDADVDAVNYSQSSALHVACQRSNYRADVVDMLLQAGAHLDRRNMSGKTPASLLADKGDLKPLQHITLKCLAARAMQQYQLLPDCQLPSSVEQFVAIH